MAATKTKRPKPDLFAAAAAVAEPAGGPSSKTETIWAIAELGLDEARRAELTKAVAGLLRVTARKKQLDAEQKKHKQLLEQFADERWATHIVETGETPPQPIRILTDSHQSVNFIVQDRGELKRVSDERLEELAGVVGAEAAAGLVVQTEEFSFSTALLDEQVPAEDGKGTISIRELVGPVFADGLAGLVKAKRLTREQADGIVCCTLERRLKPGLLGRLADVCSRSREKLLEFLGVLGGAIVRYVK